MLETIKHTFGFCGEPHPSILWLIGSGSFLLYVLKHNINLCWRHGCKFCKTKLLRKVYVNNMGKKN